jgi:hypothetical protein
MDNGWSTEDPSGPSADDLSRLLESSGTETLPEWKESEWVEMLRLGPEAFTRALQQSEHELEQRGEDKVMSSPRTTGAGAEPAPVDTDAFQQWAQRIAHLQVLNLEDLERDVPGAVARVPEHMEGASAQQTAALALSLTAQTPEAQLLRYKLLLAQEEARKSVCTSRACDALEFAAVAHIHCLVLSSACISKIACLACSEHSNLNVLLSRLSNLSKRPSVQRTWLADPVALVRMRMGVL